MIMTYSTKDQTLALLMRAEGNFISGEDASKSMGLSRASVSAAVRSLRDDGYAIESVTNRGYRLTEQPDSINTGTMLAGLSPERMERVICLSETASTKGYLMELAQENTPDGQVVLAEMQTAGRGRTGRRFDSPQGQGIYLSYLIRPDIHDGKSALIENWRSITQNVGIVVCNTLEEACGITPVMQENALFINQRKLCGILTQTDMEVESGMLRALVVGIGIYVHHRESDLDPVENMTSLDIETGRQNCRPAIASKLILSLDALRNTI